jgi:hypothetical protein
VHLVFTQKSISFKLEPDPEEANAANHCGSRYNSTGYDWCRLVTPQEEEDSFQSFRAAVAADREQGRRPLFCLANVHSTLFQRQNVTALQVSKRRNFGHCDVSTVANFNILLLSNLNEEKKYLTFI